MYMEYYSATKNEILPCVTWMDLEGIMLTEISQAEKDKYRIISPTCNCCYFDDLSRIFLI